MTAADDPLAAILAQLAAFDARLTALETRERRDGKGQVVPSRPDPDNDDPWAAGYAAGLRRSGRTMTTDDEVDPSVVVVRMLPDEYREDVIATAVLSDLNRRLTEIVSRLDRTIATNADIGG
jgi:hypothetical protein